MTRFETTRWSVVLGAQGSGPDARAALESLCRTYRPPVLAFIRSRGYARELAEDLTQSFFARFLEREHYTAVDPVRGRFRVYLLAAIKHFLVNAAIESGAAKRGGRIRFESLEIDDERANGVPVDDETPERAFENAWATVVLDSALRRLRKEARDSGRGELFEHLRAYLAEELGENDYARVAAALNLRRNTIAVSVHRLRRRLRDLVRAEVAQTAADSSAFDIELAELRGAFGAAGE